MSSAGVFYSHLPTPLYSPHPPKLYTPDDAEEISLILRAVVKTGRFDLEREFLDEEDRVKVGCSRWRFPTLGAGDRFPLSPISLQMPPKGAELVTRLADAGRPEDEMAKLNGKFD
jgi:hypothetical protein